MYIVTGAAGFVGSNLVRTLNERGVRDILAVDDLTQGTSFATCATVRSPTTWTAPSSVALSAAARRE